MLVCATPTQKIEGVWVAVESRHYDESGWISPLDGLLLDISKDSILFTHVYSDSMMTVHYQYIDSEQILVEQKSIAYKDTIGIYQVSDDSITLLFNKTMLVNFIPVDLSKSSNLDLHELISNEWEFVWDDQIMKIHFLTEEYIPEFPSRKRCVAFGSAEFYNLFSYQGTQFIPITFGQTDPTLYHIEEVRKDTIFTRAYYNKQYIEPIIVKQKSLSSDKIENIRSELIGDWKTVELLDYYTGLEELLGDSAKYLSSGFGFEGKILSKNALIQNQISLSFGDSEYQITENEQAIFKGTYKLSPDGKYIVLDYGTDPNDYINIIKLKNNQLVIGKRDRFAIEQEGEFIEYYFKIRLKNEAQQ